MAQAQANDASESSARRLEATPLGGAAAFTLLAVVLLVPVGSLRAAAEQAAAANLCSDSSGRPRRRPFVSNPRRIHHRRARQRERFRRC